MMQGVLSGDMNKMMKQMGLNPNNMPKNMPGGMPDMSALEGLMGQGGMPDLSALGGGAGMPDMSQMFGGGLKGKSRRIYDETGNEQDGQTNAQK